MKTSLPESTNTIAPAPADIKKILARVTANLSTLRDINRDLYGHNPKESQKDIVKIGVDDHTRAEAYELIDYVGQKAEADVLSLKNSLHQFTDKNLVTIPYDVLDTALDKIQKARGGIFCINKILGAISGADLPDGFHHLYSEFSKGALYDAVAMLSEMSADQEEELHEILCEHRREAL